MREPRRVVSGVARAAIVVVMMVACARDAAPPSGVTMPRADVVASGEPHLLQQAPNTPALEKTKITFVATKGTETEVTLKYGKDATHKDKQIFAQFTIPPLGLKTRPDGRPIGIGESIEITLTVIDPLKFLIKLEPSGLKFDPANNAVLTLSYIYAIQDFNGDGEINDVDRDIERNLRLWRKDGTAPFQKLEGTPQLATDRVSAVIGGFSNYLIAY
jgi:hypothetical protein